MQLLSFILNLLPFEFSRERDWTAWLFYSKYKWSFITFGKEGIMRSCTPTSWGYKTEFLLHYSSLQTLEIPCYIRCFPTLCLNFHRSAQEGRIHAFKGFRLPCWRRQRRGLFTSWWARKQTQKEVVRENVPLWTFSWSTTSFSWTPPPRVSTTFQNSATCWKQRDEVMSLQRVLIPISSA